MVALGGRKETIQCALERRVLKWLGLLCFVFGGQGGEGHSEAGARVLACNTPAAAPGIAGSPDPEISGAEPTHQAKLDLEGSCLAKKQPVGPAGGVWWRRRGEAGWLCDLPRVSNLPAFLVKPGFIKATSIRRLDRFPVKNPRQ